MKKIFYRKLVRDKIPEVISARDRQCECLVMDNKTFGKELLKKAVEESKGLMAANSKKELVSELADVYEVLTEIEKFNKIERAEITKARKVNLKIKGGFKKRLFLIWSSDEKYKSNESVGKSK